MAHQSTPPLLRTPHPSHPLLWPIRAISLLLLSQAAVVTGIVWYHFSLVDWGQIDKVNVNEVTRLGSFVLRPLTEAILLASAFIPFALMLLMSAIGFALLRRAAWLLATICQGGILLACLLIYFDSTLRLRESNWFYLLMLLGIILSLYLNSTDVRIAFDNRRQQSPEEWLDRLQFERSEEINYLPLLSDHENRQLD
ncbi:MAG: hypothetical protein U0175_21875 [Caldilineaceae bacterium]